MAEFEITVEGGKTVTLPTAGKYVDRNIVITATGGSGGSGTDKFDQFASYKRTGAYLFYFYSGSNLDYLSSEDIPIGTDTKYMFSYATNLTSIPYLDTSNVATMSYMFEYCSKLTTIPNLDTSNAQQLSGMFSYCEKLIQIPLLNTSKVTNMTSMFESCKALTEIPDLDYSLVSSMSYIFRNCINISSINFNDTPKLTSIAYGFSGCSSLQEVKGINLISYTSSITNIFEKCPLLENAEIKNIKVALKLSDNSSYGTLLSKDSLINICKECIKQSSSKTLTIGTLNIEKLSNVYVKFVDSTQTSISTNQKGEVIVCEPTDENSMTINEYMVLKNWKLA